MIIILGLAILTIFIKIRYRKLEDVDTFLDRDYTTSIIGVFAVIIFFSHFSDYVDNTPLNKLDELAFFTTSALGQLMVVPFMFFSGYGIFEQFKKKGSKYATNLPKNRIFKVYLMFLIAWSIFLILSFILKNYYSWDRYVLSIFGIVNIGNSNWYVVVILVLYITTYISMRIFGENKVATLLVNLALALVILFTLKECNMDSCWWDSIPAYMFGIVFSYIKPNILSFYKKNKFNRWIFFAFSIGLTVIFGMLNNTYHSPFLYEGMVISFCLIFASFLSLFHAGNKIVLTLGKYCFWIYILQRIPMMIFSQMPEIYSNVYLLFTMCAITTAILAFSIDKLFTFIWNKISKPKLN